MRLGPYEIVSPLGAGGMGEVYRAHDTKLGRDVALKIVPELFASDRDRLARFTREAQTLAALNHPNIAHIHGLEESGGVRAIVMELVEGEDLAQRLVRGPVPVDEALPIARQIAEALEAAHEQGIIHRDLKPANIKLRPDGIVKVLDFGLAKALDPVSTAADAATSPTNTSPARTQMGVILGTAAYMSPEQAKGRTADRRSDIWAFGCVVYETLTGKRAFEGETLTDVSAAVLKDEPDWDALPFATPPLARSLLRRCLQKDPARRLHDIADARIEIQEAVADPDTSTPSAPPQRGAARFARAIPWIVAAVSILALLLTQVGLRRNAPPDRPVTRLELTLPAGVELYIGPSAVAFSPDGTRVAFVGIEAGNRRLYLRRLDEFETVPVRGTEGATSSFFSPDSRSIAFILTDRTMKRVSLEDGLVFTLTSEVDYTTGGAWGEDGRITFGRNNVLWQMPSSGGAAVQLTTLDSTNGELLHAFPTVIAGGKAILFAAVTGLNGGASQVEVLSLGTGAPRRHKVTDSGISPGYVASGHLIFFRAGTLLAAPFEEARLQLTGAAKKVIDDVVITPAGPPMLAVSRSGSVVYTSGTAATQLVWVSRREGREQPLTESARQYLFPRIAPDGRHVVVSAGGDLWIQSASGATFTKLTAESTTGNTYPVWSPNGRVVFRTNAGLYVMNADGSGRLQAIPATTTTDFPNSVSPNGETLIFLRTTADRAADLFVLSLKGDPAPRPLVSTRAHEGGGQFSPDGKWVAYASDESGQFQVFVRPFPGPDRKWPVSARGKYAVWNRNGRELFYRDGNKMMAVDVLIRDGEPVFSSPRQLFEDQYDFGTGQTVPNYDVSPDGQSFVMVKRESAWTRLNVVLNGFDDLTRLAPTPR